MNNSIIEKYGYTDFYEKQLLELDSLDNELIPGRIVEVHKEQYKIITEYGEVPGKLKGSIFYSDKVENIYPTVGDFVLLKYNPYGESTIYKVLERRTKFSRLDSWNRIEQVVAVNFDYVFIMVSLNQDFNIKRIERYLSTAWQSGGIPVIILTKADLCDDYQTEKNEIENIAVGVDVIPVSSYTGKGIDLLDKYIKPKKTIVFLGSSGVGKSSLVNRVSGKEVMKVNSIREDDSKGKHTTTHRQLIMLDNGTMVIDTPGMRELEMWNVTDGLDITFSEIEELAVKCKFRDCSHQSEPGCAVKDALETGELSKDRWNNYLKLKKEAEFAKRKEESNLRQQQKKLRKK
ncbi:ribosome small subunit-dependent GTPase A [Clostridium sp. 'White wine YQ']|uniref:ribosome small subunit-dependent GTPase A n=1 Tax=Clostridium sp. 'White wine YQ' TaxID=3027474 RepID=UPI0023673796|nr:ribosome small subunit-dependent GTPase A [Clostridium sp. 'White wine YQ']MDD7795464.1 ribosome small subunit-dependent GTPase A [Clostridium sp. 'White wine YQ']